MYVIRAKKKRSLLGNVCMTISKREKEWRIKERRRQEE
jgi:hypothetical protein